MFKVIDDMTQADALWHAGLLWCREKGGEPGEDWGEWWLDYAGLWLGRQDMAPSGFRPSLGCEIQYAIQLEE